MRTIVATFGALGTTATLMVDDEQAGAVALATLQRELREIDDACSRFRAGSDLARVNASPGQPVPVSTRCIEAVDVALRAASMTNGLVDPTVGRAIRVLGYDRDFAELVPTGPALRVRAVSV